MPLDRAESWSARLQAPLNREGNAKRERSAEAAAIVLALVGAAVLFFGWSVEELRVSGVILETQAFCVQFGYRRGLIQTRAGLPDFLSNFLAFVAIGKCFTLLALWAGPPEWTASSPLEEFMKLENQFWAEAIYFVAVVCFTLGWSVLAGNSKKSAMGSTEVNEDVLFRWAIAALVIWAGFRMVPPLAGLAGMAKNCSLAIVFILLAGHGKMQLGAKQQWRALLLLSPLVLQALPTGSKLEVIVAAGPVLMAMLFRPSKRRLAMLAAVAAGVVLVLAPMTNILRGHNWRGEGQLISVRQAFDIVANDIGRHGVSVVASDGVVEFLDRASSARNGALVYGIAQRDGLLGLESLDKLFVVFVPRFLWPDKPSIAPGAWFTWYLGQAATPDTATTSTGTPVATEFYWMAGWGGTIAGMLILGVMYAVSWRLLKYMGQTSIVMRIGAVSMLFGAMRLEETHAIFAITAPLLIILYLLPFGILEMMLFPARRHLAAAAERRSTREESASRRWMA